MRAPFLFTENAINLCLQVAKEAASVTQSEEQKTLDHHPESGSMAATAQAAADKNENDSESRTYSEAGL